MGAVHYQHNRAKDRAATRCGIQGVVAQAFNDKTRQYIANGRVTVLITKDRTKLTCQKCVRILEKQNLG